MSSKFVPKDRVPSASTATNLPRGISSAGTSEYSAKVNKNGKSMNKANKGAVHTANLNKKTNQIDLSKTIEHSRPEKLPEIDTKVAEISTASKTKSYNDTKLSKSQGVYGPK